MSRIPIPAVNKATGTTVEVYGRIKKATGGVPNAFAVIGALQPAALGAVLDADTALAEGSLAKMISRQSSWSSALPLAATIASPRTACSGSSQG
jgi:hypothetical protein